MLSVRRASPADVPPCRAIVEGLPDYFTEDVPDRVAHDLVEHDGWIAADGGEVAGFAVVERRSPRAAEILWIGVRADRRSSGVGTALLEHLTAVLRAEGARLVEAKTLDRSAGYEPYRATRAFWERRGFIQIDTIDPLPGWAPGNPAAIYVRVLDPPRPES